MDAVVSNYEEYIEIVIYYLTNPHAKKELENRILNRKDLIFNEFQGREGEIFSVTVVRTDQKKVYVELGRAEALLPVSNFS